jgi:hypothetical protein
LLSSRKLRLLTLVAGAAVLIIFSACGDDDASGDSTLTATATVTTAASTTPSATATAEASNSGAAFDACALLTKSELGEVIGTVSADGTGQNNPSVYICGWTTDDGLVSVNITLYTGSPSELEEYYSLTQGATQIDGLGDKAQFSSALQNLEVLSRGYDLSVSVFGADFKGGAQIQASRALAQDILARLP